MKKIFTLFALSLFMVACSSKNEGNMIVTGQIKGLKKGTLYLQKMKDTILVSVDSVKLVGNDTFILTDDIDTPELYYLTFDGNTTDKRILFFGEKGTITINNDVDKFGFQPEIMGSKNQTILETYNKIKMKFQNERLEFVKKNLEARKANDLALIDKLQKEYQQLSKRRVLYTTNFALNNADTEVAPYLGLTEMYDASLQLLDTVNNSLSQRVKTTKYGKRFQEYVKDLKNKEQ
ncbi:DUF4369 domain-containing protein [Polaribacter septentrionalilitoris]|uniref:DUF4369 domain-containing protein n=1 Tax=Polaribacter septentrionalilitoris TaxID=2494657 RepID=UPI0013598F1B|nr:DUF4369 domain-containing protein [Polaribacter septentrionalilitoris]